MVWIFIVSLIYVILIFPVFLNAQILYKKNCEKVYFKISIYTISILSGYSCITDKRLAIHYSEKKAKIVTLKDIVSVKTSIKPLIDLNILKISNLIEVSKNNVPLIVGSVCAYNYTKSILKYKKPYLKNNILIRQGDNSAFYNKSVAVFNILSLCLFIIKNFVGKIYESTKRK